MVHRSLTLPVGIGTRGMTLLEIMLAMLVLTIVVGMVGLSLSGSLRVVEATGAQGEIYYRAQVALQRISEDLSSAILVDDVDFIGEDTDIEGQESDSLTFTSMAHVIFDPEHDRPGMAFVGYSVVADEENEGELLLYRRDELMLPGISPDATGEENRGYLLSDRLRSVRFVYVDAAGDEQDSWSTFVDEGTDKDLRKVPVTVRCTLEYWLDREAGSSIKFTTGVLLPMGLMNAE